MPPGGTSAPSSSSSAEGRRFEISTSRATRLAGAGSGPGGLSRRRGSAGGTLGTHRLLRGGPAHRRPLGPGGLSGSGGALRGGALPGGSVRVPGQGLVRGGDAGLALQGLGDGPRALGGWAPGLGAVPNGIGALCALAGLLRHLALWRRRQVHAGAPGLGEADGDGLLGGPGAVLAFADVMDGFANEFARLGGGGLALAPGLV